jgi:hypothetical protein
VAQDAVDDARVGNKGDDAHAGAAGAGQGISFEDSPDQAGPSAAGLAEKSELSRASGAGAPAPGLSPCSPAQTILPRLEYTPQKRWQ